MGNAMGHGKWSDEGEKSKKPTKPLTLREFFEFLRGLFFKDVRR